MSTQCKMSTNWNAHPLLNEKGDVPNMSLNLKFSLSNCTNSSLAALKAIV